MPRLQRRPDASALLYGAFWLSGVAAVLYQLVWQRVLLGIYGVQIDAMTVVVTAFLLGLGLGSLAGGWLARRWPQACLMMFVLLELGVGACGAVSVPVFRAVGDATAQAGVAGMWAILSLLLLVPTAFMGATLPVLMAYVVTRTRNVGVGVGGLYAANTLGSAAGALAAVVVIVGTFGQQGTAWCAAGLNLLVAVAVLGLSHVERRRS